MKHKSLSYRVASKFIPNLSHRFYNINPLSAILIFVRYYRNEILHKIARDSIIFGPFRAKIIRPSIHRKRGCKIGKNVFIGDQVYFDPNHSKHITIEDGVFITARCMILVHQRDLSQYSKDKWIGDCPHLIKPVKIESGVHVGIGSIILPGVTIGKGSIIGSGSIVTKDIPPHSIAVGSPARVIRKV